MPCMTAPLTLVIRAAGTNCDRELCHAFELAGSKTRTVHVNTLIEQPGLLEQAQLIAFPGGFSYGDDIAAGRIYANLLRHRLLAPLQAAVRRGTPILGVCNGFQVLVKLGLLPDPETGTQSVTLADNHSGRFTDRWVRLEAVTDSVCVWTQGLKSFDLPIAHGEGRFVARSQEVLDELVSNKQIAIRYASDDNPNGSALDIAGVCDRSGLVLGLMPHPERYAHATHHPVWTSMTAAALAQTPAGLRFFLNAVEHVARQSALVTA
jgi:phosphoribosylformylglycinamidine synthase subunit PurQ / glutaminase